MRTSVFLLPLTALAGLSSCADSNPYDTEVSDEYAEAETFVLQYKGKVDSVYKNLPSLAELEAATCPAGSLRGLTIPGSPLTIFELQELNVDAPGTSYFNRSAGDSWLADRDPFFAWPQSRIVVEDEWKVRECADRIKQLVADRYFCVFIEDTAKFALPEIDSTASEYTPGRGAGYAVLVDFSTTQPVCAFKIDVANSAEVNYETYFDTAMVHTDKIAQFDALYAVYYDLWDNMRADIERQVKEAGQ